MVFLAVVGVLTSSINWMGEEGIGRGIMRQGAFAYNFILPPFVLLPMIYLRMKGSRNSVSNLKGLLFCLILPSSLILLAARFLGTPSNLWEASQHIQGLSEGFLVYQLGRVDVSFLRTEVGFILAALICASTAVTVSRVERPLRLWAGACLVSNTLLLFVTASFGSGLACLCGLGAIFYAQARRVNPARVIVSMIAIACLLVLTYGLSPSSMKEYLGKRYEQRVTTENIDRFTLWGRAAAQLLEHPEGVGFTLAVGDTVKSFIHNDYLTYAVSYGFLGGIAYTASRYRDGDFFPQKAQGCNRGRCRTCRIFSRAGCYCGSRGELYDRSHDGKPMVL